MVRGTEGKKGIGGKSRREEGGKEKVGRRKEEKN